MHDIAVLSIGSGDGDGAGLLFDYYHKRVSVSIFPKTHPPTRPHSHYGCGAEDRLIGLLDRAASTENDDEYEEITEDVITTILDAGKAIFDGIKPSRPCTPAARHLRSALYPETLFFRLLTLSGELSLVSIEPREAYAYYDPDMFLKVESGINVDDDHPRYHPGGPSIEEFFTTGQGRTCPDLPGDEVLLLKASPRRLDDTTLKWKLRKVQYAKFGARVQRPQGYAVHPPVGHPLGLRRDWTPGRPFEGTLEEMAIPSTNAERCLKCQLSEAVDRLHAIGVVWRDEKDNNAIFDIEDDAWLAGLERGWAEMSVDEEAAGSAIGDELGVERIVELSDNE